MFSVLVKMQEEAINDVIPMSEMIAKQNRSWQLLALSVFTNTKKQAQYLEDRILDFSHELSDRDQKNIRETYEAIINIRNTVVYFSNAVVAIYTLPHIYPLFMSNYLVPINGPKSYTFRDPQVVSLFQLAVPLVEISSEDKNLTVIKFPSPPFPDLHDISVSEVNAIKDDTSNDTESITDRVCNLARKRIVYQTSNLSDAKEREAALYSVNRDLLLLQRGRFLLEELIARVF